MVVVNSNWRFSVDTHNNHLPYRLVTVKPKDKPARQEFQHIGTFYGSLALVLKAMVEYDLREETQDKELDIKEYLDTYQRISVELTNNFNKREEK